LNLERLYESDINQAKTVLLGKIIEKQSKIKSFEKNIKTLSQDYFMESENFKKILKSIKKNDVSAEDFDKIKVLLDVTENNSKSYFNHQKSKRQFKEFTEKIDLFSFTPWKNNKYSDLEIAEFIGSLKNNEIVKQYYIVDNLKSRINNTFNENIEDNISKKEYEESFKKYDLFAKNYQANKNKLIEDYIKDYKVI